MYFVSSSELYPVINSTNKMVAHMEDMIITYTVCQKLLMEKFPWKT